jgi:DNA/RNA-binding domain of Phe-tRNA-synthetase-like protein
VARRKLLREIERQQGERKDLTSFDNQMKFSPYRQALREAGLSESTARRWQVMSLVPEPQLEEYFTRQREKKTCR